MNMYRAGLEEKIHPWGIGKKERKKEKMVLFFQGQNQCNDDGLGWDALGDLRKKGRVGVVL